MLLVLVPPPGFATTLVDDLCCGCGSFPPANGLFALVAFALPVARDEVTGAGAGAEVVDAVLAAVAGGGVESVPNMLLSRRAFLVTPAAGEASTVAEEEGGGALGEEDEDPPPPSKSPIVDCPPGLCDTLVDDLICVSSPPQMLFTEEAG